MARVAPAASRVSERLVRIIRMFSGPLNMFAGLFIVTCSRRKAAERETKIYFCRLLFEMKSRLRVSSKRVCALPIKQVLK